MVVACGSQGSGEEEDLDEEDSLSEDSGSELPDDLQEDSEQSFGKSQPTTPSPSPPATPRPTRRRRKPRSPSFSDDENRPPSPKVMGLQCIFILSLSDWAGVWQFLLLDNYSVEVIRVYIYHLKQYSDINSVKYFIFFDIFCQICKRCNDWHNSCANLVRTVKTCQHPDCSNCWSFYSVLSVQMQAAALPVLASLVPLLAVSFVFSSVMLSVPKRGRM